jgi:class 3 adenylate cyclase
MFDGAARAVQAAADIRAACEDLGLGVRIGVHTGEVEVVPGNIRGLAVHETARIMALAGNGEVLVSGTTRELASGAGLAFGDRGMHDLKGVPEPRHLYLLTTAPPGDGTRNPAGPPASSGDAASRDAGARAAGRVAGS